MAVGGRQPGVRSARDVDAAGRDDRGFFLAIVAGTLRLSALVAAVPEFMPRPADEGDSGCVRVAGQGAPICIAISSRFLRGLVAAGQAGR